jgi:hypothetical protein
MRRLSRMSRSRDLDESIIVGFVMPCSQPPVILSDSEGAPRTEAESKDPEDTSDIDVDSGSSL